MLPEERSRAYLTISIKSVKISLQLVGAVSKNEHSCWEFLDAELVSLIHNGKLEY
jgi:hypothetical protein